MRCNSKPFPIGGSVARGISYAIPRHKPGRTFNVPLVGKRLLTQKSVIVDFTVLFFLFFFSQKRTTNPWNYKSAIGWMRFDEGLPHKAAARAYWSSDELFVIRSSKKWARDNSRLPRWEPTYRIALGRGTNRGLALQRNKTNNPT